MPNGDAAIAVAAPAVWWLPAELTLLRLGLAALVLGLLVFLLAATVRLLLRLLLPQLRFIAPWLVALQQRLLQRWPPHRLRWLRRHATAAPAELGVLALAGAFLLAMTAALVELVEEILEQGEVVALDQAVFAALQTLRGDVLDRWMVAITDLGGVWITAPLVGAVALWLAWRRHWAACGYWVGAALVSRLSVVLLKWVLGRERPTLVYSGVETLSFPSGHATTAMILYGFLAFLLGRSLQPAARHLLYAVVAVLIAAIGLSRLYLGVHWLSDVGAGFALGFAWITLLALAFTRLHPRQRPAPGALAVVVLVAWTAAAAAQFTWRFDASLARYQAAVPAQHAPR